MATELHVPSAYATITAAIAAIPATLTQAYEVIINTASQNFYNEAVSVAGKTTAAEKTITIKTATAGQKALVYNSGRPYTSSSNWVTVRDLTFVATGANQGMDLKSTAADNIIDSCATVSYWSNTTSIVLSGARPKVLNTVIKATAGAQYGILQINPGAADYIISNCTIDGDLIGANRCAVWIDSTGATADGTFHNNVVSGVVNSATGMLVEFNGAGGIVAGTTWNYNFYGFGSGSIGKLFKVNATYYTSVSAFNAATSQEANGVEDAYGPLITAVKAEVDGLSTTDSNVTRDYSGQTITTVADIGPLDFVAASSGGGGACFITAPGG